MAYHGEEKRREENGGETIDELIPLLTFEVLLSDGFDYRYEEMKSQPSF